MTSLSDESVKEFQRLYRERYGKEISFQEAYERGTNLVNIMRAVYLPITNDTSAEAEKE